LNREDPRTKTPVFWIIRSTVYGILCCLLLDPTAAGTVILIRMENFMKEPASLPAHLSEWLHRERVEEMEAKPKVWPGMKAREIPDRARLCQSSKSAVRMVKWNTMQGSRTFESETECPILLHATGLLAKVIDAEKTIIPEAEGILRIEQIHRDETVFNLEVEGTHDYFVTEDGVLVHNYEAVQAPEACLSLAEIKERYAGFRGTLENIGERFGNLFEHGSFVPDYNVIKNGSDFSQNMSQEQINYVTGNLNRLADSTYFERTPNGNLAMVQQIDVPETHPITAKMLQDDFGGNMQITFLSPEAVNAVGRGSRTISNEDATAGGVKGQYLPSLGWKQGENRTFISLIPEQDAAASCLYFDKDGNQVMSSVGSAPEMTLAHELIHAEHFATGTYTPHTNPTAYFELTDSKGSPIGWMEGNLEEAKAVGPPLIVGGIKGKDGSEIYIPPPEGQPTENSIRAERGLPLRLTYFDGDEQRDPEKIIPLDKLP